MVENKTIVECKPVKLWNTPSVVAKKLAAEQHFVKMGLKYELIDPGKLSDNQFKKLLECGTVKLTERYKKLYDERYGE